jgi:hypothetical protein
MTTLAIVGSRDFSDYPYLKSKIEEVLAKYPTISHIVSGGARGADSMSDRIADTFHLSLNHINAEWKKYGRRAGPIRNQKVINEADLVIAFPLGASPGTRDAISRAKKAGKEVIVWEYPS